jgi:uncharacterized protein (DUF2267 family)
MDPRTNDEVSRMIDLRGPDHEESPVFDALLDAAMNAGVARNRCEVTVRTVLESLTEHLPSAARDSFLRALPADARALALPPERGHHTGRVRERDALGLVRIAADLHDDEEARRVVNAVLAVVDTR